MSLDWTAEAGQRRGMCLYLLSTTLGYSSMMNRFGNSPTSRTIGLRIGLVSCDSELNVQDIKSAMSLSAPTVICTWNCLSVRIVDWKRFHAFNLEPGPRSSGVGKLKGYACCDDISIHQPKSMCHYHSFSLAETSTVNGFHWSSMQCWGDAQNSTSLFSQWKERRIADVDVGLHAF